MSLSSGTRLGCYQIDTLLGAGGMGEVYRARDSKLGREVAIKVLPDAFTQDPERLARFEREARVLAALNHPNIASIYGLEESNGTRFLVLELVPGETLADIIGGVAERASGREYENIVADFGLRMSDCGLRIPWGSQLASLQPALADR